MKKLDEQIKAFDKEVANILQNDKILDIWKSSYLRDGCYNAGASHLTLGLVLEVLIINQRKVTEILQKRGYEKLLHKIAKATPKDIMANTPYPKSKPTPEDKASNPLYYAIHYGGYAPAKSFQKANFDVANILIQYTPKEAYDLEMFFEAVKGIPETHYLLSAAIACGMKIDTVYKMLHQTSNMKALDEALSIENTDYGSKLPDIRQAITKHKLAISRGEQPSAASVSMFNWVRFTWKSNTSAPAPT